MKPSRAGRVAALGSVALAVVRRGAPRLQRLLADSRHGGGVPYRSLLWFLQRPSPLFFSRVRARARSSSPESGPEPALPFPESGITPLAFDLLSTAAGPLAIRNLT